MVLGQDFVNLLKQQSGAPVAVKQVLEESSQNVQEPPQEIQQETPQILPGAKTTNEVGSDFLALIESQKQEVQQKTTDETLLTGALKQQKELEGKGFLANVKKIPGSEKVLNNPVVKNAIDFVDQIGIGAMETLEQLGNLVGVETAPIPGTLDPETGKLKEPETFFGGIGRTIGEFTAPVPGTQMAKGISALKSPLFVKKTAQIKNLLQPIANFTGNSLAFIGETLTSIPRQFLEKAIRREVSGKSILKGTLKRPENFKKLGVKAQVALNEIVKDAGKQVGVEKTALRNVKGLIDIDDVINSIDDDVAEFAGDRISGLTDIDSKKIDKVKDMLLTLATDPKKPGASASELLNVRNQIDDAVKFTTETVSKASPQGERILKKARKTIVKKLESKSKSFAEANKRFSKLADVKQRLVIRLKDANVARNVKSMVIQEDDFFRNALKEVDELAPKGLKFYDELENEVIRHAMAELFPGRGGGSGGTQGVANFLRLMGSGATGGLATPAFSPRVTPLMMAGIKGADLAQQPTEEQ